MFNVHVLTRFRLTLLHHYHPPTCAQTIEFSDMVSPENFHVMENSSVLYILVIDPRSDMENLISHSIDLFYRGVILRLIFMILLIQWFFVTFKMIERPTHLLD